MLAHVYLIANLDYPIKICKSLFLRYIWPDTEVSWQGCRLRLWDFGVIFVTTNGFPVAGLKKNRASARHVIASAGISLRKSRAPRIVTSLRRSQRFCVKQGSRLRGQKLERRRHFRRRSRTTSGCTEWSRISA